MIKKKIRKRRESDFPTNKEIARATRLNPSDVSRARTNHGFFYRRKKLKPGLVDE